VVAQGLRPANEVFVANLQPLKPGEEDLAFSCALPMNAKGIRVLSRKSYEASAVSVFDNPLSSRFDENDALLYFDDVKVPWERLFVYRDTDTCRAQFHDTPGHAYQNYQAQIRLSVKIRFLVGLARRVTEAIDLRLVAMQVFRLTAPPASQTTHAFPIRIPVANTSNPPTTIWKAARRNGVSM
jgi:aromatic ring hydroxylase